MREAVTLSRLVPQDLLQLERQPSQRLFLGTDGTISAAEAEGLAAMPQAWCVHRGSVPIACFGVSELFPGQHGVAWAMLGSGLGADHLRLTRFVRAKLAACQLNRIETFVRCVDVEHLLARSPQLDSGHLVALAMLSPTAECRWAAMLGFRPAHVLRRYGAGDETYMMMERILPPLPWEVGDAVS
ncbi:hypothetical protein [Novosphingobium decolorationis]|uniref:GNAT family N-acetyltransferase n=1 Tax=Novosphingobium decolorationis TaxID=2698673 RepID=A0ABX8E1V8_9SPHN|nr:hypothetical protein [Novosphingobium decolorationis]QVM82934.1 hypothetical protein HT578_03735 [Novosphingobium decolorationis]